MSVLKRWTGTEWEIVGSPSSDGALGQLAYITSTTLSVNISAGADLTGLTTTINVPAGRAIKVTGGCCIVSSDVPTIAALIIDVGGTNRKLQRMGFTRANEKETFETSVIVTGLSGSTTFKLEGTRAGGGGTITATGATGGDLAFLLVEDIGPA